MDHVSVFSFFPDITCHHLESICRQRQILTARKPPQKRIVTTAKKRKVLTCVLWQSLRFYSPDLGRFVNIPGYSLDTGYASVFLFCFFYPERWADQNAGFLSSLSPSRQMWTVLAESLHLHPCRQASQKAENATDSSFQTKIPRLICIEEAFIVEVPSPCSSWRLMGVSGRFDAYPPASTGIVDSGISSSGSGTALRRPPTETRPAQAGEGYFTQGERDGKGCAGYAVQNTFLCKWSQIIGSEDFGILWIGLSKKVNVCVG